MEQKSALCEASLSSSERDGHVTTWRTNVDDLTPERSTVAEERPVSGLYLEVVIATTVAEERPVSGLYLEVVIATTVAEEHLVSGLYLEVVIATTSALHVELEVEQSDADCLAPLDVDRPPALGVHVVFVGVVGTRDVAAVVESDGLPLGTTTL